MATVRSGLILMRAKDGIKRSVCSTSRGVGFPGQRSVSGERLLHFGAC
jgi:hypothetical protein